MKLLKKVCLIIISVFVVFIVYYEFIASRPEKTVKQYVEAINEANYEQFIGCFEPKVQKASQGILGIGSSLLGIDMEDILNIVPEIIPVTKEDYKTYKIYDVHVIQYKGCDALEYLNEDSDLYFVVGCFLGKEAIVEFTVSVSDNSDGKRYRMILNKYDTQWLIPGDEELIAIE